MSPASIYHIGDFHTYVPYGTKGDNLKLQKFLLTGIFNNLIAYINNYTNDGELAFLTICGDFFDWKTLDADLELKSIDPSVNEVFKTLASTFEIFKNIKESINFKIAFTAGNHDFCSYFKKDNVGDLDIGVAKRKFQLLHDFISIIDKKVNANYDIIKYQNEGIGENYIQGVYEEAAIEIISLNTAYYSYHEKNKNDFKNLKYKPENIQFSTNANFKLLIHHHPFYWLKQSKLDKNYIKLTNKANIILVGHEHEVPDRPIAGKLFYNKLINLARDVLNKKLSVLRITFDSVDGLMYKAFKTVNILKPADSPAELFIKEELIIEGLDDKKLVFSKIKVQYIAGYEKCKSILKEMECEFHYNAKESHLILKYYSYLFPVMESSYYIKCNKHTPIESEYYKNMKKIYPFNGDEIELQNIKVDDEANDINNLRAIAGFKDLQYIKVNQNLYERSFLSKIITHFKTKERKKIKKVSINLTGNKSELVKKLCLDFKNQNPKLNLRFYET